MYVHVNVDVRKKNDKRDRSGGKKGTKKGGKRTARDNHADREREK